MTMKIMYPITESLSGGKYFNEIISLAIMEQAGLALFGQADYISITPEMYSKYCLLTGGDVWNNVRAILTDGGRISELEVFILAPVSILNEDVYQGLHGWCDSDGNPLKFSEWKAGGEQPVFTSVDGTQVILRTNIGGVTISPSDLLLLLEHPEITLYSDYELSQLLQSPLFNATPH